MDALAYDVPIDTIMADCLARVAALAGVPASELRPAHFQMVQHEDGRWAGRVTLRTPPPIGAGAFETGGGL